MPYSLEFYKKVDNEDLGSFTVIDGIAEDKRNFLAGEISGSFTISAQIWLKITISKMKSTHSAISDFIIVVNLKSIEPQFLLLFILWKLKSGCPRGGTASRHKTSSSLPPKQNKNIIYFKMRCNM